MLELVKKLFDSKKGRLSSNSNSCSIANVEEPKSFSIEKSSNEIVLSVRNLVTVEGMLKDTREAVEFEF